MATLVGGLPTPINGNVLPPTQLEGKYMRDTVEPVALNSPDTKTTNGDRQDPFTLASEYAYTPRRLKVFTVGAGFSGLLMAHKFQHRFEDMDELVDHTIFEARPDIGGTWLANDYPGVQCDVPAHIYVRKLHGRTSLNIIDVNEAFPFDPNPNWSRFYATGPDILAYMKATVQKWSLDRDLKLGTKVIGAWWQEHLGQWKVTVEHNGRRRDEFCHVLISAQGVLV